MKLSPTYLLAFFFACSAHAQDSGSRLVVLKKCQDQAGIKLIKEADVSSDAAIKDLDAAIKSLTTYQRTCSAYGETSTQSDAEIKRISAEGQTASSDAKRARHSSSIAHEKLGKAIPPADALGAKECGDEMRNSMKGIKKSQAILDVKAEILGSCMALRPISTSAATSTQTATDTGIGGGGGR